METRVLRREEPLNEYREMQLQAHKTSEEERVERQRKEKGGMIKRGGGRETQSFVYFTTALHKSKDYENLN